MTKEQVNIAIINGLKNRGHEVLKLNPDLLADFANITYKLLNIHDVVFNEAVTEGNWVLDEPEPLYKDYDTEVKSEVELFCSNCKSTHVYQPEPESIKCYRCGFYGAK